MTYALSGQAAADGDPNATQTPIKRLPNDDPKGGRTVRPALLKGERI
jgi:hypothetical protein